MKRFAPALLLALTPACVVQKSVGEDPETAGVGNEGPGDATDTTSSTSGASATSQGGTGTATPSYEACGVTVVPVVPGGPRYTDILECAGGCTITIHSGAPTGFDGDKAIGDCLCQSIDCGGWTGNTGGGEEGPVSDESGTTSTGGNAGCGFDPAPGNGNGSSEYSARCICETCEFVFEDIAEADAIAFTEDESICECLCEQGNCGVVDGYGEVSGVYSSGEAPDSDGSGTTSTSG